MASVTDDKESSPRSITSNESPASDKRGNQSTVIFKDCMVIGTDEDASNNVSPVSIDNQSTILLSHSMLFGTDKDAGDITDRKSISSSESLVSVSNQSTFLIIDHDNEKRRFASSSESSASINDQSTILFSHSMIFGTEKNASHNERLRSISSSDSSAYSDSQPTILFSPASINDQSTILYSQSMKNGTEEDASHNEKLRSISSSDSPASSGNRSTILDSDTSSVGTNEDDASDNTSPRSLSSIESPNSINSRSTIIFNSSLEFVDNKDDSYIMSPKESNINSPKVMNATCTISTKSINDLDADNGNTKGDESEANDAVRMVSHTFLVGEGQNETFLYTDAMRENEPVSNNVKCVVGDTFIVGKAQDETFLSTNEIRDDLQYNDKRKMLEETFIVGKTQDKALMSTYVISESVFNDSVESMGKTFNVSGVQNGTFLINGSKLKRGKHSNMVIQDTESKRAPQIKGNRQSRCVDKEKDDIPKRERKPMNCLNNDNQKSTRVEVRCNYTKEEKENIIEMEKAKQSAFDVKVTGARPKERRLRAIQTMSSSDDELEPYIRFSRRRQSKARALVAISAMLKK